MVGTKSSASGGGFGHNSCRIAPVWGTYPTYALQVIASETLHLLVQDEARSRMLRDFVVPPTAGLLAMTGTGIWRAQETEFPHN